jgi:hypothetical protein
MIECYDDYGTLIYFKQLIPLVMSFRQEDLCIHPLHFALDNNVIFVQDLACKLPAWRNKGQFDLFFGAPTSITRKLDFGDKDKEAMLRRECHIPEEVEFDTSSYYLFKFTLTFSFDRWDAFHRLEEHCRNVGRSKTAINPVVAVMYALLHKSSRNTHYTGTEGVILEAAVKACMYTLRNWYRCTGN